MSSMDTGIAPRSGTSLKTLQQNFATHTAQRYVQHSPIYHKACTLLVLASSSLLVVQQIVPYHYILATKTS
jgi:hypothetical protein